MTDNNYGRVFFENIRFDQAPVYASLCIVHGISGFTLAFIASQQDASFPPGFWTAMYALPLIWVAIPFVWGGVAVINERRDAA